MKKRHLSVMPPYQDNTKDKNDESSFDIKLEKLEKHIKQENEKTINSLSFVSEIKRLLKLLLN